MYVGCPTDVLHRSDFVDLSVPIGSHDQCGRFVQGLVAHPGVVATLPDWIVWGDDMDLIRLARSPLPIAERLRILPARSAPGLAILGSKTGLVELAAELGLPQPRSVVVRTQADLALRLAQWRPPFFVKGERGGGGARLLRVSHADQVGPGLVPDAWFPVLLQEVAPGTEIAIEALFGHGRLLAWVHSTACSTEGPFGRHTAREFSDPQAEDFASTLQLLASAAGLHGLANCTFIRTADPARHLLIEADMRANAWHQFGPRLGVDWGALMRSAPLDSDPARPRIGRGRSVRIRLHPRELVHAATTASWTQARPWLVGAPGTWADRNSRDRSVNAQDRRAVAAALGTLPRSLLRRVRSQS